MNLTMPWNATKDRPVDGLTSRLDDVRRTLSEETDRLAAVAAQLTRDAGRQATNAADEATVQASTLTDDAARTASGFAQQLMKGAAVLGGQLATSGRKAAAELGRDAKQVGQDLRHVRVTTEPRRTGPDLMPGIALLGGFGAGIALMYFMDPEQGRRRRALLRDQMTKWSRIARETGGGKAKDMSNRAVGAVHETRKAFEGVAGEPSETQPAATTTGDGWGSGQSPFSDQPTDEQQRVEIS